MAAAAEGMLEKPVSSHDVDGLADRLFTSVMRGEWKEVEEVYKNHSEQVQNLKVMKSEDTALHIAVSLSDDGQKDVALRLVDIIIEANKSTEVANNILNSKNRTGNTALHIAAARGDVKLCHKMAMKDPKLVSVRNNEGQTPLFLAAQSGKEENFFCLHSHCRENCSSYRADNGDTFLHAAISGEYFRLAFQIFQWYPHLVNSMNQNGMSPLHILASAPTAFKSSNRLGPCDRLTYHCLVEEELKEDNKTNKACPVEKQEAGSTSTGASSENVEDHTKTSGSSSSLMISIEGENPQPKSTRIDQGERLPEQPAGADHYYRNCICAPFLKFCYIMTSALVMIDRILPAGISSIKKIREKKRQHVWASQVMKNLVDHTETYRYVQNPEETICTTGKQESNILQEVPNPEKQEPAGGSENNKDDQKADKADKNKDDQKADKAVKTQTPILIAAKNGVTEMVKYILEKFPVAIQDLDSKNKNVALLAVENRQPHVFNFLVEKKKPIVGNLLCQLDNNSNNALHLAAKYGPYRPWLTPGAALQMQWEVKWYQFVKGSMPPRLSVRPNEDGEIPEEIFTKTHKELQKQGGSWLVKTSESCSVVAALIATVAFATSASVPGGLDNSSGEPIFRNKPVFDAFTISSLLALCLSVTALVFFLSILTSRYEAHDFSAKLPRKLLFGLTSLFASIGAVLVSFCTGHVFLLDRQLKHVAYPMYAATCLPVTIFALAQLSLYYDLIRVIFKKVPQRSYKEYKTS